jgi:hypothetical protein
MEHLANNPYAISSIATTKHVSVIIPSQQGREVAIESGVAMRNLLKRFLAQFFSKWVSHCEAKGLESIQCPLCGSAKRNSLFPLRGAVYLGRVRFGTVNEVAPIENAVDKDTSV